jgi:uncharacterized protein YjdB
MKKNMLMKVMAMCLVLVMVPAIVASAHPFVDVPVGCWYDEPVQYVYENGFMYGTSDTAFSPNKTMDRGMIVAVLYRMNGSPAVEKNIPFKDVGKNDYFYNAVCWAYNNGITNGVSATEFAPAQNVTRTQMVTMFYRCYGNNYTAKSSELSQYADVAKVPAYARNAFAWAIKNNIVAGTSATTLSPDGVSTRAQCATIIKRIGNVVLLTPPQEVVLKLDQSDVELVVGDTLTLNVTYTGNKPLTWTSSDELTATVDQNGLIETVGKGVTYITVSDGNKFATCRIKVSDTLRSITITPPRDKVFVVGKTYQFYANISSAVGTSVPLVWKTSNESIATIDQNGLLTAIAKGSCYVEASCGKSNAVCMIKVDVLANEIVIGYTDGPFYDGVTRYVDDYVVVTAVNMPVDATRTITAKSSNPNVVEVAGTKNNGNSRDITLNFKSAGTAKITLTSGDGAVSQSYIITVKDGYDFDPGDRQLTPEEFADYTTKVMCANGFTEANCTGWRQVVLAKDKLTFDYAVSTAYARGHEWWPNGCRYCKIVYIGQDANGDYVFHTCWG